MSSISNLLTKPGSGSLPKLVYVRRLHVPCGLLSSALSPTLYSAFSECRNSGILGPTSGATGVVRNGISKLVGLGRRNVAAFSSISRYHCAALENTSILIVENSNHKLLYNLNSRVPLLSVRRNQLVLYNALQTRSIFFIHFRSTSRRKSTGAGNGSDSGKDAKDEPPSNDSPEWGTRKREHWLGHKYGYYDFRELTPDLQKIDLEFVRGADVRKLWEKRRNLLSRTFGKEEEKPLSTNNASGNERLEKSVSDGEKKDSNDNFKNNLGNWEEEGEIDPITLRRVTRRQDTATTNTSGNNSSIISAPPASSTSSSVIENGDRIDEIKPRVNSQKSNNELASNAGAKINDQRSFNSPESPKSTDSSAEAILQSSKDIPSPILSRKDVEKRLEKDEDRIEKLSKEFSKIQEKIQEKNKEWIDKRIEESQKSQLGRWGIEQKESKDRDYKQELKRELETEKEPGKLSNEREAKKENTSIPQPVPILHPYQIPKKERLTEAQHGKDKTSLSTSESREHGKSKDPPVFKPPGFKHLSNTSAGLEVESEFLSYNPRNIAIVPPPESLASEPTGVKEEVDAVLRDIESAQEVYAGIPSEEPVFDSGNSAKVSPKTSPGAQVEPGKLVPDTNHSLPPAIVQTPIVLADPLIDNSSKGLILEAQSTPPVPLAAPEIDKSVTGLKADTPIGSAKAGVSAELEHALADLRSIIETLKPLAKEKFEGDHLSPALRSESDPDVNEDYKILTISTSPPYHILATEIEGNVILRSTYGARTGISIAEFLPKLKCPYLFLHYLPQLQNENWKLVAGGEEMLVFVRSRTHTSAATTQAQEGDLGEDSTEMKETFSSSSIGFKNSQTGHGLLKDIPKSQASADIPVNSQLAHDHYPWNYGGMSIGGIAGDFGSFGHLPSSYNYNYPSHKINPIDMTRDEMLPESQAEMVKELQKEWDGRREDAIRSMKEGKMKAQKEVEMKEKEAKEKEVVLQNREVSEKDEATKTVNMEGKMSSAYSGSEAETSKKEVGEETKNSGSIASPYVREESVKKKPGPLKRFFKRLGWTMFYLGGGIILIKEAGFYLDRGEKKKEEIMDGILTGSGDRERDRRMQERVVPLPVGRRIGRVRVVDDVSEDRV